MLRLGLLVSGFLVSRTPLGYAGTPDLFGLGSASTSLAGAATARATDFSAVYYNPAGLALGGAAREASLGFAGYASQLHVGGQSAPISDPIGFEIGVRAPIPLGGFLKDRLALGFALHLLPDELVHVIAHEPPDAFFPYYENRTQSLVIIPGVGMRLTRRLSLGVAFNLFAGLSGNVETAQGATRTIEPRIDEKISSTVHVHAGLRFDATDRVTLGLTYRQASSVPFRTATKNQIAGESIDVTVDAQGLFTPDEIWGGIAVRPIDRWTLSLDGGYLRWSAWQGPYVAVSSVLPIAGPFQVTPPELDYHDIFSMRAGLEWAALTRAQTELAVRAGAGYEPSPLPDQVGVTNMMDGDKIILAAGIGLRLRTQSEHPVRIDAHAMAHVVGDRTYIKQVLVRPSATCPTSNQVCGLHDEVRNNPSDPTTLGTQISNPGYPSINGGGTVWEGGVTVTWAL